LSSAIRDNFFTFEIETSLIQNVEVAKIKIVVSFEMDYFPIKMNYLMIDYFHLH